MSGPDVEGVLVRHEYMLRLSTGGVCLCGFVPTVDPSTLATQQDYHRAHVAAAVLAEVRAWLGSEGAFRVAAETIWTTSRADEATISVIGAKHAATAALAALAEQVGQVAPSRVPGEGS